MNRPIILRMHKMFRPLAFLFLAAVPTVAQPQTGAWTLLEGQHPQVVVAEEGKRRIPLLLSLPKDFASRKSPLIVYLHGAGQRGQDVLLFKGGGISRFAGTQPDSQFAVAWIQLPAEAPGWSSGDVLPVIDELLKRVPLDPNRIYLTGVSMGGNGTWLIAAEHPQRFAAIAPISSKGDSGDTCRLKGVPVWAFHNERDKLYPVSGVKQTIDRFRACGGKAELTIYPRDGHDAWSSTYRDPALYKWFLSHE